MNKIKLICFSTILATGVAYAKDVPCNGFEIKIQNKTTDNLLISQVTLHGARIKPDVIQELKSHAEQTFTVSNSEDSSTLQGVFELHSISVPSKKVLITYILKNKHLICYHDNKDIKSDYKVHKARLPGKVDYTISG